MLVNNPKSICVVGGGTAGFVAALILKSRFPNKKIDIIRSSKIGIIGVGEGSTEHWAEFINFIGVNPKEVIKECDATLKSGIMFQNWTADGGDYLHSIQDDYSSKEGMYNLVYAKLIGEGKSSKDLGTKLIWDNLINQWFLKHEDQLPTRQFHFNTNSLNRWLEKTADRFGINIYDDIINDVVLNDKGISSIKSNTRDYNYDFYIDSTGFKRLLIGKLGAKWQSYSKYLKMNSAIVFPTPDTDNYNEWTIARAMDAGWMFRIPTYGRWGNGYIFNDQYTDAEKAKKEVEEYLGHEVDVRNQFSFDPGAIDKPWIDNCVAIGLSGSFVEPLEATSIGTSIQQSFLLMHKLVNYNDKVIKDYNKSVNDILTNIRDFVILHYITDRKDTPFWKDLQGFELPETLKENIEMWKHKMPVREDFSNLSRYILFHEEHHLFVMHGLKLFNTESIRKEFEELPIELKLKADKIVNSTILKDETVPTMTHKEYLRAIRNAK